METFIFQSSRDNSAKGESDIQVPMLILVCTVQSQAWKYTGIYVYSEFLENPMSTVADILPL